MIDPELFKLVADGGILPLVIYGLVLLKQISGRLAAMESKLNSLLERKVVHQDGVRFF